MDNFFRILHADDIAYNALTLEVEFARACVILLLIDKNALCAQSIP